MHHRPRAAVRILLVIVTAHLALVACGSNGAAPGPSNVQKYRAYNSTRSQFTPTANARAQELAVRIVRSGLDCANTHASSFDALRPTYLKQDLPLPIGSVECEGGPAKENVVIEIFRSAHPNAFDFVTRKAALICRRGISLGRLADGTNGFPGLPYVMAADKSWLVEPDTQTFNAELARALGRPPRDACSPYLPRA